MVELIVGQICMSMLSLEKYTVCCFGSDGCAILEDAEGGLHWAGDIDIADLVDVTGKSVAVEADEPEVTEMVVSYGYFMGAALTGLLANPNIIRTSDVMPSGGLVRSIVKCAKTFAESLVEASDGQS